MGLPKNGWKNKVGTGNRICKCGSWKQHWINYSGKVWPATCSVEGCQHIPVLGAHVYNKDVQGERIVPMCDRCNKRDKYFSLKNNVACVYANTSYYSQ